MLKRPTDVALRHFDLLFSTFQCRSWIGASNESACRDQYVELLDNLRDNYSASLEVTDVAEDLIDFLMKQELLKAEEHLLYLFKLCCLCVSSASPTYQDVRMGSIDTSGKRARFLDIVLPIQRCLSGVPGSIELCVNDANLASFSLLSASFGRATFSASYEPWETVAAFGRSRIYKSLLSSYRSVVSGSKGCFVRLEVEGDSSVIDESALKVTSSGKRR